MSRMVVPQRLIDLRQLRPDGPLSQEQAADRIGVSRETLRRLESGNAKAPFPSTLAKLCRFYGVTPAYLFGIEDEPTETAAA